MNQKCIDLIIPSLFFGILLLLVAQEFAILEWIETNLETSIFKNILQKIFSNKLPVFSWLFGTYLFIRFTSLFLWELYFPKKTDAIETPKIIKDIYSLIIWVISIGIALSIFFNKDITALLTASSVVVGVLGLSLRAMIADFFYGIAITLEHPFRVGDWIEVGVGNNTKVGKVQQISWRSTLIITKQNIHITVPHSVIGNRNFNNYSYPDSLWRSSFNMSLSYDVTVSEAERIFFSAIKQIKELEDIPKEPGVSIIQFLPYGIEWNIQFWVKDYPMESSIRLQIQRNILRDLSYCGISLYNQPEYQSTQNETPAKPRSNWVRNLDLFACLTDEDCRVISEQAIKSTIPKSKALFEQGSEGSSLFLIYQGLMDVYVKDKIEDEAKKVNRLCAGAVFGEMSLLTGHPRNATVTAVVETVVYEINKAMIEPYLREHPLLLEHIENLLTERKLQNIELMKNIDKHKETDIPKNMLLEVQQQIRRFFNL